MTKERFEYLDYKDTVKDNFTGKEYHTWYDDDLLGLLNGQDRKIRELRKLKNRLVMNCVSVWWVKAVVYRRMEATDDEKVRGELEELLKELI